MLRYVVTVLLIAGMISPAWGGSQPLGTLSSGRDTMLRNAQLTPGSTLFSGDAILVGEHGAAHIALSGGAQAEVFGDSLVRMTAENNRIEMAVDHGRASFHTAGGNGMTASVGGVTVRPAGNTETSAIIQSLSKTHAVVAAEKGALLVTTNFDGRVYTIPEGEAADLSSTTAPADPQRTGPAPGGKAAPAMGFSKNIVIWTVAVVGAGAIIAAVVLTRGEAKLSTAELQNEISPHSLN